VNPRHVSGAVPRTACRAGGTTLCGRRTAGVVAGSGSGIGERGRATGPHQQAGRKEPRPRCNTPTRRGQVVPPAPHHSRTPNPTVLELWHEVTSRNAPMRINVPSLQAIVLFSSSLPTRNTPPSATMLRTSTMATVRSSECRQLGSGCRRKGAGGRRIKGLLHCQPSIRGARRGVRHRAFGRRKLTRSSIN
jgi:hypothetical protein